MKVRLTDAFVANAALPPSMLDARLSDLLDRYDRHLERRQYVNRRDVLSSLRTRMVALLSRDILSLSGSDFAKIIEGIRQKRLAGAAEAFRTHCQAFLTWCVTEAKVLPVNPLAGHRKERATRADRIAKEEYAFGVIMARPISRPPNSPLRLLLVAQCRFLDGGDCGTERPFLVGEVMT